MGFFESFYVQRINKAGNRLYRIKTLDSEQVESWESIDGGHTKVFMRSGDTFILRMNIKDFGDIIIDNEDAYGKMLVFSKN